MVEDKRKVYVFEKENGIAFDVEKLYRGDLTIALAAHGIQDTDKNIQKAREICKEVFYDYLFYGDQILEEKIEESDVKWEGVYTIDSFVPDKEIEKLETGFMEDEGTLALDMRVESILSLLIQVAGNICERHASDIFFLWKALLNEIQRPDYKGGKYLFGFREDGIDDTRHLLIKYKYGEQDEIKRVFLLEVEVVPSTKTCRHIDAITMTLSKAKEVSPW